MAASKCVDVNISSSKLPRDMILVSKPMFLWSRNPIKALLSILDRFRYPKLYKKFKMAGKITTLKMSRGDISGSFVHWDRILVSKPMFSWSRNSIMPLLSFLYSSFVLECTKPKLADKMYQ